MPFTSDYVFHDDPGPETLSSANEMIKASV